MLLKELFEQATKDNYIDLQALIMFLVFEKQVLSMDDDSEKLDLYFLEKHSERMNQELHSYKRKMNMKYNPKVFEVKGSGRTIYIYAHAEEDARLIAFKNHIVANEIKVYPLDKLMNLNGKDMTLRSIVKGKKAPEILGGF